MELKLLKATDFKAMIQISADHLADHVDLVNALNVFPVPDGDTGTNMNMTYQSGAEAVSKASSQHVGELSKALGKGLLMGARGNSGVILSQIFRGFSQAIEDFETLDARQFALAFIGGVEAAYKAVMKPVEGTILTVARESALAGEKKAEETDDIIEVMREIVAAGHISLENTPNLLPVLKQVGVVDSGGKGLMTIYEGFLQSLSGEKHVKKVIDTTDTSISLMENTDDHPVNMEDITYGYCSEIMVRIGEGATTNKVFDYETFRNELNEIGDSLLVVADDEIIKVHIHTEEPGDLMRRGQEYGELIKIKIENMREQVRELEARKQDLKANAVEGTQEKLPYAIITVAAGEGIHELLKSFGVHKVLEGGQTMNPSTQDFVDAMEEINAEHFILLPNNKNIVMAAEQAAEISETPTSVLVTTSVPEGIAAMIGFNAEQTPEENMASMEAVRSEVKTGQITNAIRDSDIDGVSIKEHDYMGIVDGDIVLAEAELKDSLQQTLEAMITADSEIVTIYVGEEGDFDLAEEVAEIIEQENDEIDIEIVQGDQPVYHYIISVE